MAVRLQLETGEVKRYRTWHEHVIHTSEPPTIVRYFTKCGQEWDEKPSFSDGCDHLNCAIYAASEGPKEDVKSDVIGVLFFGAISVIIGLFSDFGSDYVIGISCLAFLCAISVCILSIGLFISDCKEGRELKEFRDHGTVNRIKAKQI